MPNNELQVYDYLGTLAPEVRGSLKAYYLQLTRTTTDQFSVADRVGQLEDSFFYGTVSYIDQHFSLHVMCVFISSGASLLFSNPCRFITRPLA